MLLAVVPVDRSTLLAKIAATMRLMQHVRCHLNTAEFGDAMQKCVEYYHDVEQMRDAADPATIADSQVSAALREADAAWNDLLVDASVQ